MFVSFFFKKYFKWAAYNIILNQFGASGFFIMGICIFFYHTNLFFIKIQCFQMLSKIHSKIRYNNLKKRKIWPSQKTSENELSKKILSYINYIGYQKKLSFFVCCYYFMVCFDAIFCEILSYELSIKSFKISAFQEKLKRKLQRGQPPSGLCVCTRS